MRGPWVFRRYLPAAAVVLAALALAALATVLALRSIERQESARRVVGDTILVQQAVVVATAHEATSVRGYIATASSAYLRDYEAGRDAWARARPLLLRMRGRIARIPEFVAAGDALQQFFAGQVARVRAGDRAGAFGDVRQALDRMDRFAHEDAAVADGLYRALAAERAASGAGMRRAIVLVAVMGVVLLVGGALATLLALRARMNAALARTDPLTKLPNRRGFEERLAEIVARREPQPRMAVLYVDLDGFKAINDRFGHEAGDEVLVAFGDRLRAALRPSDTVARIGGDEFAALLDRLEDDEAETLAERITSALDAPLPTGYGPFYVSASVGIALLPDDGEDAGTLLRAADEAMYRVKRTRRTVTT